MEIMESHPTKDFIILAWDHKQGEDPVPGNQDLVSPGKKNPVCYLIIIFPELSSSNHLIQLFFQNSLGNLFKSSSDTYR